MAAKRPVSLPADEYAYVPATSNTRYNKFVRSNLSNDIESMPPAYQKLAHATRDLVRDCLGPLALPASNDLRDLIGGFKIDGIDLEGEALETTRLTAHGIRQSYQAAVLKEGAKRLISHEFKGILKEKNHNDLADSWMLMNGIVARYPKLIQDLANAAGPGEAQSIIAKYRAQMYDLVDLYGKIKLYQSAKSVDMAIAALAEKLGAKREAIEMADVPVIKYHGRVGAHLMHDMLLGNVAANTDEQIEAAFKNLQNRTIGKLLQKLADVDDLHLPMRVTYALKIELLELDEFDNIDQPGLLRKTRESLNLDQLADSLANNEATAVIQSHMRTALRNIERLAAEMVPPREDLVQADISALKFFIAILAVNDKPGMSEALEKFFTRDDVKAEFAKNADERTNESLAMEMFMHYSMDPEINSLVEIRSKLTRTIFAEPREVAAFKAADGEGRAVYAGYHAKDIPMLAQTFVFYKAATGCTDDEAIQAALDPQSKARRFVGYGGRFTRSPEEFREGLRLLDMFHAWYTPYVQSIENGDRSTATRLNFNDGTATYNAALGVEVFVFEDIARNPSIALAETDCEKAFGMEHNQAMRFVGRGYTESVVNTVMTLTPEKRRLVYDVFDVIEPLAKTQAECDHVAQSALLVARILKNYDDVVELREDGRFNRASLVQLLYGDLNVAPNATNAQIEAARLALIDHLMEEDAEVQVGALLQTMTDTGAPYGECLAAVREGRSLAKAPGLTGISSALHEIDGTANGGRQTMVGDLHRPTSPTFLSNGQNALDAGKGRFAFVISGGKKIYAAEGADDDPQVKAANDAIADSIERLCGAVHQQQLAGIYYSLSQSAIGPNVRGMFTTRDIASDEHMAVTISLAKDNETGAVTITCSEPESLKDADGRPIRFHWTTTVALDGTITNTPMVIEPPQ